MDSEFVNVYISKQKALIDDLQSRLLLCESHLEVTKNAHAKIKQEFEQALQKLEAYANQDKAKKEASK